MLLRHTMELERCAAYIAARATLAAIHDTAPVWPDDLATQARRAAIDTVMTTAEGLGFDHGTPARRRCVRDALTTAIALAATVDVARAMGLDGLERVQLSTGRTVALLGLLFAASTLPND